MKRFALGSAVTLIALLVPSTAWSQAQLIRDINTQADPVPMEYSELTSDGAGTLYFVSEGGKFYKSNTNETPQRAVMLRSLGHASQLTVIGTTVFFVGEDGAGRELWRSNGTGGTTRKVKEIRAGSSGSNPMHLTNVNGVLYFSADDGVNGRELWKSDGTEAGTVRVRDINPGSGSSSPEWITEMNGVAYFSAFDAARGENLWKSDGTAAGTALVIDIRSTNAVGEGPAWITNVNGTLFFSCEGVSTGIELWKSDGTRTGTHLVKDIFPGPPSSNISQLTAMNGAVYFSATNRSTGLKLWRSDGTNTTVVATLLEGETTDRRDPAFHFTAIGNYLYYLDYYSGNIVVTDGTPGGTSRAGEESEIANDPGFTEFNGMIYYLVIAFDDEVHGKSDQELRKMKADDTARALVKSFPYVVDYDEVPLDPSFEMVEANGALYFPAIPSDQKGTVMMKSDGTSEGTVELADTYVATFSSNPYHFAVLNGFTFFSAEVGLDEELWRTDGTSAGSIMLQRLGSIYDVKTVGNLVYFAGIQNGSFKIWRTDGTAAGTVLLKDLGPAYDNNTISLEDVYGTVYFTPGHGELWKSNGTPASTVLLKDFYDIEYIGYGGGRAIFLVRTSANATELWRSSGTTNSTAKLRTMNPNSTLGKSVYPAKATVNDIFYFPGNDPDHAVELWRSNGTTSGTYRVTNLAENDYNVIDIYKMFNHNNTLFFTAATPEGYAAIYGSDGTREGTTIVNGLPGGDLSSVIPYGNGFLVVSEYQLGRGVLSMVSHTEGPFIKHLDNEPESGVFYYTIVNNVVYFTYGRSLWRTDGTECGTRKMTTAVNVYPLASNGSDLIFAALHPDFGREPYRMPLLSDPGNPCGAPEVATAASLLSAGPEAATSFTYGPNPFTGDLTFRIDGDDGETATIQVTGFTGEVIETVKDLGTNTDHKLGGNWPKGIYVIKAIRNGKTTLIRIVKK